MNNEENLNGAQESGWYDDVYKQPTDYHGHYTQSRYYFIWSVISDRMIRSGVKKILDLGCGPGQFAALLYDKGLRDYCGMDFSSEAIILAKRRCPNFKFLEEDIIKSDVVTSGEYDCVVSLEFLEHVKEDTGVIERIRPGTKFYGTVPNFPYISHVRHFNNEVEVISRYCSYFSEFHVDEFLQNMNGAKYFLIEGIKT
ncbi:MAG: class I SAM-dependent methyltransferase [bacterium]|nr:class I SAM-dependent methyltransferase [bacterium]